MSPTSWAVYHYLCPELCITIYLPHQLNCLSLSMSPINWAVAHCLCLCQLNCVSLSLPHHLNYVLPSPSPTELCLTISASSNLICHYPCPSPPTELSLTIFAPTNWTVSHYSIPPLISPQPMSWRSSASQNIDLFISILEVVGSNLPIGFPSSGGVIKKYRLPDSLFW